MDDDTIQKVLDALSNAGLCVCDKTYMDSGHPAMMPSDEYVIGRIEVLGKLDTSPNKCVEA